MPISASTYIISAIMSLTPILELRGGIPFALLRGASLPVAYLLCVSFNALVGPLAYTFLSTFHKLFMRWKLYNRLFERLITRARRRVQQKVERYGYWGIMLFVAIPLPITGAYTGTLGAWVLGLEPKRTFLAVAVGVLVAGVIVSAVTLSGIEALGFLIKKV